MSELANLVWAKMKGYPWWPGIVQDTFVKNKQVYKRVQFFSCNQQYRISSADFKENDVKDFKLFYEEFKNGSNREDFRTDLQYAHHLIDEDRETSKISLPKIAVSPLLNQKSIPDMSSRLRKSDENLIQELKYLALEKQSQLKPNPSNTELERIRKSLTQAILEMNSSLLIETLIEIHRYSITKDQLKGMKLAKILGYYIKHSQRNESDFSLGLLDLTKYIFNKWKIVLIKDEKLSKNDEDRVGNFEAAKGEPVPEEKVPVINQIGSLHKQKPETCIKDPSKDQKLPVRKLVRNEIEEPDSISKDLRESIRKMISEVLMKNGFDYNYAGELAENIEYNLALRDKTFGKEYKKFTRFMIKDIKQLDINSYNIAIASLSVN